MTVAALALEPTGPSLCELLERPSALPALGAEERVPRRLWEQALHGPLREFLSRPGKQFRAELVRLAYALIQPNDMPPPELPALVEMLHAGSLIVDDIEDQSPARRGSPALHCVYGLPVALNAGNWLYFWPFACVAELGLGPAAETQVMRAIGQTLLRCHSGQALDLSVRVTDLGQHEIPHVVAAVTRLKTGSLTEFASVLGALAAGATSEQVALLGRFGSEFGVALQMLDDLSGIVNEKRCHKGHEDLLQARPTWPWAWLSHDLADNRFLELEDLAREVARRERHPELLAAKLRERLAPSARTRVHQHMTRALDALRPAFAHAPAFGEIVLEVQRLEAAYV